MTETTESLLIFDRYRDLVDDGAAFEDALRRPLPTVVWANPFRITRAALEERLANQGWKAAPLAWDSNALVLPPEFPSGSRFEYLAGLYHVQEAVSLLPPLILDPKPGERVLDFCASPGGKTARLAALMENGGTLVANDRGFRRVAILKTNLERLGVMNASLTDWNAAAYPRRAGSFDAILADVPCSCEGTSRKQAAEGTIVTDERFIERLARLQEDILTRAVQLCRPGGRIVYSTCTYSPVENECVVDSVLRRFGPSVLRMRSIPVPGLAHSPGLPSWRGRRFDADMGHALRIWPHQNDTGGFFIALLEKIAPTEGRIEDVPAELPRPLPASEVGDWAGKIEQFFGVEAPVAGTEWFAPNREKIHFVVSPHRHPAQPTASVTGLPVLRRESRFPKLSTSAAMAYGPRIRKSLVDLTAGQYRHYVRRETCRVEASQLTGVNGTATAYVVVRYDGWVVGVGVYHQPSGQLQSLYPKVWGRELA